MKVLARLVEPRRPKKLKGRKASVLREALGADFFIWDGLELSIASFALSERVFGMYIMDINEVLPYSTCITLRKHVFQCLIKPFLSFGILEAF